MSDLFAACAAALIALVITGLVYATPAPKRAGPQASKTLHNPRQDRTMFKIVPNPTFTSRVLLTVPGAEPLACLGVTWRHKGRAALAAWLRKPADAAATAATEAATAATQATTAATQAEPARPLLAGVPADALWLAEVMADWDGPVLADGQPAPFTEAALAALLDSYPAAGGELLNAYLRASTESRAKN